jgi:hypothetical protein
LNCSCARKYLIRHAACSHPSSARGSKGRPEALGRCAASPFAVSQRWSMSSDRPAGHRALFLRSVHSRQNDLTSTSLHLSFSRFLIYRFLLTIQTGTGSRAHRDAHLQEQVLSVLPAAPQLTRRRYRRGQDVGNLSHPPDSHRNHSSGRQKTKTANTLASRDDRKGWFRRIEPRPAPQLTDQGCRAPCDKLQAEGALSDGTSISNESDAELR